MTPIGLPSDSELVAVFCEPVRLCATYKPAFGRSGNEGVDLAGFTDIYGADPFYAYLGLDSPSVYAAHKAAGGLTSVYRQIGVGSERLLRAILAGTLGLQKEALVWSYSYAKPDGTTGEHRLDARVSLADLNPSDAARFRAWLGAATDFLGTTSSGSMPVAGMAMEIRQGYKSADSKRQNADLRFGMRAYQAGLLPAVVVLSSQVSQPVIRRYRTDGMMVLTGQLEGSSNESTFTFFREVVGYDLQAFMDRNRDSLRAEVTGAVRALLEPE